MIRRAADLSVSEGMAAMEISKNRATIRLRKTQECGEGESAYTPAVALVAAWARRPTTSGQAGGTLRKTPRLVNNRDCQRGGNAGGLVSLVYAVCADGAGSTRRLVAVPEGMDSGTVVRPLNASRW